MKEFEEIKTTFKNFVSDWEKRAPLAVVGVADSRAPRRGKAEGKASGGRNPSTFLW